MPLQLAPVTKADLDELTRLHYAAFVPSAVDSILYPNGHTPSVLEDGAKQHGKTFGTPNSFHWKVVDTDRDSKMAAFAVWRRFREEEIRIHGQENHTLANVENDVNTDFLKVFDEGARDLKKRTIADKPRLHLSLLCTSQDYRRRGAATMLLEKGAEIADKERLDSSLVATAAGAPLYTKVGFKDVEGGEWQLDLRPWGQDETVVHKVMWRPLESKGA